MPKAKGRCLGAIVFKLTPINFGMFMEKNYPLRRWQSKENRALLCIELDELKLVIRPKFESLLGKLVPISYTESHFKKRFRNSYEAQAFAKKMKSPFEIEAEEQGFVGDLVITYN